MPLDFIKTEPDAMTAARTIVDWAIREKRVADPIGVALDIFAGPEGAFSPGLAALVLQLGNIAVFSGDSQVKSAAMALQRSARRFAADGRGVTFADAVRTSFDFIATDRGIWLEIDDASNELKKDGALLAHLRLLLVDAADRGAKKIKLAIADGGIEISDDASGRPNEASAVFVLPIYPRDSRDLPERIEGASNMHEWLAVSRSVIALAWDVAQELLVERLSEKSDSEEALISRLNTYSKILFRKSEGLSETFGKDILSLRQSVEMSIGGAWDLIVAEGETFDQIFTRFLQQRLLSLNLPDRIRAAYQGRKWISPAGGVVTTLVDAPQSFVCARSDSILRVVDFFVARAIARRRNGEALVRIEMIDTEIGWYLKISDAVSGDAHEIYHSALRINDGAVAMTDVRYDPRGEFKNRLRVNFDPMGGRLAGNSDRAENGGEDASATVDRDITVREVARQLSRSGATDAVRDEMAAKAIALWQSLPRLHELFPHEGAGLNPSFLNYATQAMLAPLPVNFAAGRVL